MSEQYHFGVFPLSVISSDRCGEFLEQCPTRTSTTADERHRTCSFRWLDRLLQERRERVNLFSDDDEEKNTSLCRFFGDAKPTLASPDYSSLVIFIVGGVTAHEIQLVQEYSQQMKKQVNAQLETNSDLGFISFLLDYHWFVGNN